MNTPPPIKFTEPPDNTLPECDATLGFYLRAWDQVEGQLLPLFTAMLGTHQNATLVLLRVGIDQPTLRNILEAIAALRLKPKARESLLALLRRWKSASTKRNRIVHGHWMLSIKMVEGPSGNAIGHGAGLREELILGRRAEGDETGYAAHRRSREQ